MKKIDKFILQAFAGPFLLTLAVVTFILLIQQLVQYTDELLGKGLGYDVFAELIIYFALHLIPLALPLAVLLSTLITFGNLGEHLELTAMKASGISLVRIMLPIFLLVLGIAGFSFWYNDQIVPQANLKVYSLLWDIKQKSPSLSLKEGAFYNGLPGYSIKVGKKLGDGSLLKNVMIYNHTQGRGNRELIVADSGRMYTIMNERYLVLELFKGNSYHDQVMDGTTHNQSNEKFVKNTFAKSQIVFSLASFDMKQTDEKLFQGHKVMHNTWQLMGDMDSLRRQVKRFHDLAWGTMQANYRYHLRPDTTYKPSPAPTNTPPRPSATASGNTPPAPSPKADTSSAPGQTKRKLVPKMQQLQIQQTPLVQANTTSPATQVYQPSQTTIPQIPIASSPYKGYVQPPQDQIATYALNQARSLQNILKNRQDGLRNIAKEYNQVIIEWYKKFTFAFACITMFFIGAPLGAIIKKGGLGVPVLISIIFFITFYVISLTGEKWVKESLIDPLTGMWMANVILMAFGIFFMRQARNDSRLFEADFYYVWQERLLKSWKNWLRKSHKFREI